jgi:predicted nucleic acid-binding Zn ribbon protein
MKIMKSNEKKEGNKMTHLSIFLYIFNSFFCNVKSFECCNDNNEASESSDDEESDDNEELLSYSTKKKRKNILMMMDIFI